MQNAIISNAKAVTKMQSGDYEGAFNQLRFCMASLSGALEIASKLPPQECQTVPPGGAIIITSTLCDTENDRFYSGSLLFTIPEGNGSLEPSRLRVEYCMATCLFNMALACHLEYESSQDARQRSVLLKQARTLYLTCYEIMQKHAIDPTDSIVLLVLATCANIIDIEMDLGNLDDVRFWRQIIVAASNTASPLHFADSPVFEFFDTVYVPPGELIAAMAA